MIGIVGMGFVGSAVYYSVNEKDPEQTILYDPYKMPETKGNKHRLLEQEALFLCLPSPLNEHKTGQDFSVYKEFLDWLIDNKYDGTVIIKSTVLWSNVKPYVNDLHIVMNPEFLCASTAYEDFRDQKYIVLGGNVTDIDHVQDIYKTYFTLTHKPEYVLCTHKEAIECKYIHNCVNAIKCICWTMVAENVDDYRKIFKLYSKLRGTTESIEMARVGADGKAFGAFGACFYKDLIAYNSEISNSLLAGAVMYNEQLKQKQGVEL